MEYKRQPIKNDQDKTIEKQPTKPKKTTKKQENTGKQK